MSIRIGITRSLLFYHYFPLWRRFFECLGMEIILSPETTRRILERGMRLGVGDLCLPMKVHLGHIESLKGKVDYLFLPRLVSFSEDTYLCPKFLGLPDSVRAALEDLPSVLTPCFNAKVPRKGYEEGFLEMGRVLGFSEDRIKAALGEGLQVQSRYEAYLREGWLPLPAMRAMKQEGAPAPEIPENPSYGRPRIAVLGHPYNLYDAYLNFHLLDQVAAWGYDLLTPEMVPPGEVERGSLLLRKKIYWSLTRQIVGAALSFIRSGQIEGLIFIASFGCGPDSFSKELIDRRIKKSYHLPYLSLILDEHSSEAGLQTRLDAFQEMIERRAQRFEQY